jgi:alpha-ketoglutarate-dependent taurine dioxygenase
MSTDRIISAGPGGPKSMRRKAVSFSQQSLVRTGRLEEADGEFPLVVVPAVEGVNLAAWAEGSREFVEAELLKHGSILFRGFDVPTVAQFESFTRAVSPDLLDYRERAAPRVEVGNKIYTSTEYPADQQIPLHHEMSYSHNWPTKIWFYCVTPAAEGGATPIAPSREVFRLLDPRVKETFLRRGVMYTRNYGEGVDLTWQEAFQTDDRAKVEEYCRGARTEFEWKDGNRLRTRQVRQVVAMHPRTGETVWFNHAHMFHISNVEPSVRASLLKEFDEDELPRNAFYGDGAQIESSVLDHIREVYREASVRFPWRAGDILMLDNFLAAHGREPFVGPRRIVVALAELYTNRDI